MIDLSHCNEWQFRDETGMILPWYTKSFLDELVTWDLKDKAVLEIGMGASTLWWNKKAAWVTAFDLNKDWYYAVVEKMIRANSTAYLPLPGKITEAMYSNLKGDLYDIVIIDCDPVEFRDPCIEAAIQFLNTGGHLIIDNWDQPSVWVPSDETRNLLAEWPAKIYSQEGHPDWKTLVATKP